MGTWILGFLGVCASFSALLIIALCKLNSSISREEDEQELNAILHEHNAKTPFSNAEKI